MKYNPQRIQLLEEPLSQWRRGIQPTGQAGRELGTFITNVSRDRWSKHFPSTHRYNWVGYEDIKYAVPLAFIDYLLTPKSAIVKHGLYRVCTLDKEYNSIPYLLTEFKLQFPRVVTVLQANHLGIRLLPDFPDNVHIMVKSIEYQALHYCCLGLRRYVVTHNHHTLAGLTDYLLMCRGSRTPRVIERYKRCASAAWEIYLARNIQHIDTEVTDV